MNRFNILSRALDYIENNIQQQIKMQNIAKHSYCSLNSLQKLFRYTFNYSIKEYITKRRLTLAARELYNSHETILEIALKYGYNSPENFSRAFKKLWGVNPSEFRASNNCFDIFPKIIIEKHSNAVYDYHKDVTNLYDYLAKNQNLKIICFDVVGLIEINKISRNAGDKAIMEAINRIYSCKEKDQPLFRLGGDEFALLVENKDLSYCIDIKEKILSMNGICFEYDNQKIPLKMKVWIGTNTVFQSEHDLSEKLISNVKHTLD